MDLFVLGFTLGASLTVPGVVFWHQHYKELQETRQWLRDEIGAHEKTRHALREAATRMRRENRERVMGLIAEQRAE